MAVELKNRTYETVKKCDDMCIHLNTIAFTGIGQTDKQTD